MEPITLSKKDFFQFYEWLCLNEEGITWQGKYHHDFHDFWNIFFLHGISLDQLISRFGYVYEKVKVGPLNTWFRWLEMRFIIYCFIYKNISIEEISEQSNIALSKVAFFIRDFYLEQFPSIKDNLNEHFELADASNINADVLKERLQLPETQMLGSKHGDTMSGLEVTLYPEWQKLLQKMRNDFCQEQVNIQSIKQQASLYSSIKFIREVLILLCIAILVVFALQWANKFYGNYIAEKIEILEPKFAWLNKDVSFKNDALQQIKKKEIISELSELERIISKEQENRIVKEERFETESDVIISSVDQVPHRLDWQYEENEADFNFRGTRFGYNRVYRMIVQSAWPATLKKKFATLLKKYQAIPADKVLPGTQVPGGLYYNLYIPNQYLKEFIAQITEENEATLYETKARGRSPTGKNRVFIFIKSI